MQVPNHRVAWGLGLAGIAVIAWLLVGPRPDAPRPRSVEAEPLDVEKLAPSVGVPSDEKLEALLDEVEKAEAERFGAAEAKARRLRREQLLPRRFDDEAE